MRLRRLDVGDAADRFRFDRLAGAIRYSAHAPVRSTFGWRGGALYGMPFDAAAWTLLSGDGRLRLRDPVALSFLGGRIGFEALVLRPPAGDQGLRMQTELRLEALDIGALTQALDLPAFEGTLEGRIPAVRYADNRIEFDGGLSMELFDGRVDVAALSIERPFGVAPTVSSDLAIHGLDLHALTNVFGFGSIEGRLHGRIDGLRLIDWSTTAFDAELHTERTRGARQRISQRAVQNISSVGDASFVTSLQGQLIGLFDDFGYRAIGISCRLRNEVCRMGGLRSGPSTFTIVDGSGLPRLMSSATTAMSTGPRWSSDWSRWPAARSNRCSNDADACPHFSTEIPDDALDRTSDRRRPGADRMRDDQRLLSRRGGQGSGARIRGERDRRPGAVDRDLSLIHI